MKKGKNVNITQKQIDGLKTMRTICEYQIRPLEKGCSRALGEAEMIIERLDAVQRDNLSQALSLIDSISN